jgi:hypothetical protein
VITKTKTRSKKSSIEETLAALLCAGAAMVNNGAPFLSRISSTVCYRPVAAVALFENRTLGDPLSDHLVPRVLY